MACHRPTVASSTSRLRHPLVPLAGRYRRSTARDRHDSDLVITVCDLAHEELGEATAVHWSIPDPVPAGAPASFDAALTQLADRVSRFAPRLVAVS